MLGPRCISLLATLAVAFAGCKKKSEGLAVPKQDIYLPDGSPWNVIVIVVDTLRADHLGYAGHERAGITPNIDALAAESFIFDRAYSSAPWTRPAMASLMSGKYPQRIGVTKENKEHKLQAEERTLGEFFGDQGMYTAAWFTNPHLKYGMMQGIEERHYLSRGTAEEVYGELLPWLDSHIFVPFFLLVHTIDPHDSYEHHEDFPFAPEKSKTRKVSRYFKGSASGIGDSCAKRTEMRPMKAGEIDEMRACYDQEIAYTDRELGRFLTRLRDTGLLDKSVLIFTADHGEEFLDHDSLWHGCTLYDELLRVPLLIRVPGIEGRRIDEPVSLVDIFPTLHELYAPPFEKLAPDMPGQSLLPLMGGEPWSAAPLVAATDFRGAPQRMFLHENRKLIVSNWGTRVELYNLEKDPDEQVDLLAAPPFSWLQSSLRVFFLMSQ